MARFVVFALCLAVASAAVVTFENDVVIRVPCKSSEECQGAMSLSDDVWAVRVGEYVDMRVSLDEVAALSLTELSFEIVVDDVEAIVEEQRALQEMWKRPGSNDFEEWYEEYHPLEEIYARMDFLIASFDGVVSKITLPNATHEGRDIFGLKVTTGGSKPIIAFDSELHAREYIAPATTLFIVESLLGDIRTNSALDSFEWHFFPVMNPDGYVFCWESNRMWRKNRRDNGGSYGVDLNRNFDANHCGTGASTIPSSDTYCGPFPHSEPEVAALADYLNALPNLVALWDMHSFSQYVLRPLAWTRDVAPDEDLLKALGDGIADAITNTNDEFYRSMRWNEMYVAAGTITDEFYEKRGTLTFCVELRDRGRYGFLLPPEFIIPTGQESYSGVVFMADFLAAQLGLSADPISMQ